MLHTHFAAKTSPVACRENQIFFKNYRITVLTSSLFRVEEEDEERFCDKATQMVWFRNMEPNIFTTWTEKDHLVIDTGLVELVIEPEWEHCFLRFKDGRKEKLSNDENLLGTYRTLDCCDGDYWIPFSGEWEKGHRISLEPGVISKNGVALLDDSNSLLLYEDGTICSRETSEKDVYIFAYGKDYRGAVQALFQICGRPPVLPRFALGNWWSRYYNYTQSGYIGLMDSFAEREIPFTVATVDMDWHWSENLPDNLNGWTGYSWNTELFPDYKEFLQELHRRKYHVTLNLHPADGVRYFEDSYEEMAKLLGVDPVTKETVSFDLSNPDFVNAYFDILHKPYERDGVDFWWIDWQQGNSSSTPGLDPLWMLNHYHSLDIAREKDPLILSRYAGIGSHRYPIGFSGDTHVTWKTLKYLPYFTATASNAGYTWWSHDIGGHMWGNKDDELYIRFLQFGVFSPINRLHSTKTDTFSKDPAYYTNGTGQLAEKYLRMRHKMIPFLYSASCETSEKGLPLIEPMYYEYPEEPEAYECGGQYLFGRQLLVAPITEKSTDSTRFVEKKVWLPEGKWTDLYTGDEYDGGGWKSMVRPLDYIPVLAREGGFFVLDRESKGNQVELPKRLTVLAFSGNGCYTLYEDGQNGRALTEFQSERKANTFVVRFQIKDEADLVPERSMRFEFRNIKEGNAAVKASGKEKPDYSVLEHECVIVELRNLKKNVEYEICVDDGTDLQEKKRNLFCKKIAMMEGDNREKERIYQTLCGARDRQEFRKLVENLELPVLYQKMLLEQ